MLTQGASQRTLVLGACSNPSVVVKIRRNGIEGGKIIIRKLALLFEGQILLLIEILTASSLSAIGQLREYLPTEVALLPVPR